ncbi:MAG: HYR domain-containing protein [Flavobacteriales bacterium]
MKKCLLFILICASIDFSAQNVAFWTENFGAGCNTGTYADGFFSLTTGVWHVSDTGPLADTPNNWFVSAAENGNAVGACGTACGNNPTLHLGADQSPLGSDLGAAYFEGLDGFCSFFGCAATDRRAESPTINCSGIANISISFKYIEGGNAIDNATLWYYDGSSWTQIADMPKTVICANLQGQWSSFNTALPLNSNNNTAVKIGFRWVNNDDGDATDPSFAVDDIVLNGDFATDAVPPVIICPNPVTVFTDVDCGYMPDIMALCDVTDDVDPFPALSQVPEAITSLPPGTYNVTVTATDVAGNFSSCSTQATIIDDDAPVITCSSAITIQASPNATSAEVNPETPTVFENCGTYTLSNSFNTTPNASGTYPVGVTQVVFSAFDNYGNIGTCTSTITILANTQDCCLGDLNCDGVVAVTDMLILLQEFGCAGNDCFADLDGDNIVGVSDMQIFTGVYGIQCN